MIRLALAQAIIGPHANITLRGNAGRFRSTPDHTRLGRAILFLVAAANLVGAALAFGLIPR